MPRFEDSKLRPRRGVVAALAFALSMQASAASAQGAAVPVAFSFSAPTYAAAPAGDARLFIVERAGVIRVLQDGAALGTPFLDISDRVAIPPFSEAGLLGLVFAPDYTQSGVFFLYYTGDGDPSAGFTLESRVSRFTASGDPATSNVADPQETILFRVEQPAFNHNGGTLAIRDGWLYLGLGDGGGAGDPEERAQNDASPLGKMLRFDLSQQALPWTPETWAKGLRNPFRFSFDRSTGDLYIGDVGQSAIEEIDAERADTPGGRNYGWDVMEGSRCFPDGGPDPGEPECNDASLVLPIHEYAHDGGTCSVTGGAVYRGSASPSLRGLYFFSDFCSARIWTLRWNRATGIAEDVSDRTGEFPTGAAAISQPVAITEDGAGELVLVSLSGSVYRLIPEPGTTLLGGVALSVLAGFARRAR
ncbi:MAG: PQQ-dependent sugar dehydrogenase [Deltaproteobacteria bacterium]|nr:PQQ-dependent sugar dehydrogenase [Deltaproteobacteria bacterium]